MKILYVEDDARDADLTRRDLAHYAPHLNLEVAATLAEARLRLAAQAGYDLALVDLHLPDGSGLDLLAEIRKQGLPVAVVVLTGSGDEESAVAALKAGADDYLVKQGTYLAHLPLTLETALARFQAETSRRAGKLRVLYAEHHAADVDLTRRHLARYAPHIQLEVVYRADEVLKCLSAHAAEPCPYDVLLLDYRLPGLNALELLKTLRNERRLDLPVVLVTGQGNEEVAVQSIRLGATDYLIKHPGYLYELPATLENAYHQAQLARERTALRESEARFHRLAENAPDLIYRIRLAPEYSFEYVSPAATAMTGYTPEEHYADPDLGFKLVHPDDRPLLEAAARGEIPAGRPLTLRWVRKDGAVIWTEQRNTPVYDEAGQLIAIEGIARDITERKQAEEALRESEERYRSLVKYAPDAIFINLDDRVVLVNQACLQLFGARREVELLDKSIYDLFHPDFHPFIRERIHHLRDLGESVPPIEERIIRLDGGMVDVEVTAAPFPFDGVNAIHVILRDITVRRQAEAQLAEQLDELRRWHAVTLGREGRVSELKREVNELLRRLGEPARYPSAADP